MKCPVCPDVTLSMTERHGIEVDYCPQCRGVWLDRGELDKIVAQVLEQDRPGPSQERASYDQPTRDRAHPYPPTYDPEYHRRKKKWWHDMFDFD